MITWQPFFARAIATARPIPRLAPVIKAILVSMLANGVEILEEKT
jgi:hypothetical protein